MFTVAETVPNFENNAENFDIWIHFSPSSSYLSEKKHFSFYEVLVLIIILVTVLVSVH